MAVLILLQQQKEGQNEIMGKNYNYCLRYHYAQLRCWAGAIVPIDASVSRSN